MWVAVLFLLLNEESMTKEELNNIKLKSKNLEQCIEELELVIGLSNHLSKDEGQVNIISNKHIKVANQEYGVGAELINCIKNAIRAQVSSYKTLLENKLKEL